MNTTAPQPWRYAIIAAVWFAVSVAASGSGRIAALAFPRPQLVVAGLTLVTIIASFRRAGLRSWLDGLDLRWLVGIHVTRLVAGGAFVLRSRQGDLTPAFAMPAGYGDMAVAILAIALLLTGPASTPGRRRLYALWNGAGFIDLVLVVLNAGRVGRADPTGMQSLLMLPLSILPTFLVPLLLASHVVIFRRVVSRES